MALNYIKSGSQALVDIPPGVIVLPGGFHIIGKQLGIALSGGDGDKGDVIAVALDGVWELPCEGEAFLPATPLNFSVANLTLYAGIPELNDFENVALAWTEGGDTLTTCKALINAHMAELVS